MSLDADGELETRNLVATIAKLGVDPSGHVGGAPTTIFNSVTPPEKHVRAALSGVLGAAICVAALTLAVDAVLALIQRALTPRGLRKLARERRVAARLGQAVAGASPIPS